MRRSASPSESIEDDEAISLSVLRTQDARHGAALVRADEQPLLRAEDIGPDVALPAGLVRIVEQGLVDLSPWLILPRTEALARMVGLRARYKRPYVPFARRQDNDDLAVLLPDGPNRVVIVHDFASEGWEMRTQYETFWDWFRAAVEDMIEFE